MIPEMPPVNSADSTPPVAPPPSAPQPPVWNLGDLGLLLGLGAVALAVAYATVTIGYVSLSPFTGWRVPPVGTLENAFLSLALQLVFYLFLLGVIYALVAIRKRLPFWNAMKWRNPSLGRVLGYAAGGMILSIAVQLAPAIFPDRSDFPLRQFFTSPATACAVGAFAVLVAPLMEEMIFRGVLYSIFEDQVGRVFAIVSTAVLFAGLHIPEYRGAWNHLFLLLIVGLVFSLARGLTGSLVPSVILHTAYNLTQLVTLFIATDHFRAIEGALLR